MVVQFHESKVLFDGGQVAMDPACCCTQCVDGNCPTQLAFPFGVGNVAVGGETYNGHSSSVDTNTTCDPITTTGAECVSNGTVGECTIYAFNIKITTDEGDAAPTPYEWEGHIGNDAVFYRITITAANALPPGFNQIPVAFSLKKIEKASRNCIAGSETGTADVEISR